MLIIEIEFHKIKNKPKQSNSQSRKHCSKQNKLYLLKAQPLQSPDVLFHQNIFYRHTLSCPICFINDTMLVGLDAASDIS